MSYRALKIVPRTSLALAGLAALTGCAAPAVCRDAPEIDVTVAWDDQLNADVGCWVARTWRAGELIDAHAYPNSTIDAGSLQLRIDPSVPGSDTIELTIDGFAGSCPSDPRQPAGSPLISTHRAYVPPVCGARMFSPIQLDSECEGFECPPGTICSHRHCLQQTPTGTLCTPLADGACVLDAHVDDVAEDTSTVPDASLDASMDAGDMGVDSSDPCVTHRQCTPGQPGGCGNCGSRTCGSDCQWQSCGGQGCNPGNVRQCGICNGTQMCSQSCGWGSCTHAGCNPGSQVTCHTTQSCQCPGPPPYAGMRFCTGSATCTATCQPGSCGGVSCGPCSC